MTTNHIYDRGAMIDKEGLGSGLDLEFTFSSIHLRVPSLVSNRRNTCLKTLTAAPTKRLCSVSEPDSV